MGVGGQHHASAALPLGKDPVHIVQEAGWAPGLVWTCAENLSPTGIRSPDRPARSAVAIPTTPAHYRTVVEYENVGWIQMADSGYSRHVGFRQCGGQSSGSTKCGQFS